MSDKEMNMAILNKLYEIADKVFIEGVNVKEGNYTASDLAKMKDSALLVIVFNLILIMFVFIFILITKVEN